MRGLLEEVIQTIPTIMSQYEYETEKAMNPAFQLLENSCPLRTNQKKIFVLRKDLKFVLGVKNFNSGRYNGKNELYQAIEEKSHSRINLDDRFGHPSIAMPEKDYDGSVYLAAWLCQREAHIEIILVSGRFHRILEKHQQKYLELYIAQRVMNAYGDYDVHFHDNDEDNAYCFFNDIDQFDSKVRKYPKSTIKKLNKREAEVTIAREKYLANIITELKINPDGIIFFEDSVIQKIFTQTNHDLDLKIYFDKLSEQQKKSLTVALGNELLSKLISKSNNAETTQAESDNKVLKIRIDPAISIQKFFKAPQINESTNTVSSNTRRFSIDRQSAENFITFNI